jgi:hypothetical protein
MVDALRNPMPMSTISTRPLDVAESFEKKKVMVKYFIHTDKIKEIKKRNEIAERRFKIKTFREVSKLLRASHDQVP